MTARSLPPPFTCAICERHLDMRWPGPPNLWPVQPVCRSCEQYYGKTMPPAGTFRDRRIAQTISALAEAIHTTAAHMEQGHACPRL